MNKNTTSSNPHLHEKAQVPTSPVHLPGGSDHIVGVDGLLLRPIAILPDDCALAESEDSHAESEEADVLEVEVAS